MFGAFRRLVHSRGACPLNRTFSLHKACPPTALPCSQIARGLALMLSWAFGCCNKNGRPSSHLQSSIRHHKDPRGRSIRALALPSGEKLRAIRFLLPPLPATFEWLSLFHPVLPASRPHLPLSLHRLFVCFSFLFLRSPNPL